MAVLGDTQQNYTIETLKYKDEFPMEIGQIFMIYGKCLLIQSSRGMIFFKIENEDLDSPLFG